MVRKKKKWPLYQGVILHEKLGLEPDEHFHPDGFEVVIEGRTYFCLPATKEGAIKKPRMMANCQYCGVFFLISKLVFHEPHCKRIDKRSFI
jgi:hypothetical protein